MRVIAGSARSLKLKTLEGIDTRPTTDRIKETLFNMIAPYLYDCEFLDLFAGSGGIGIEALSRGAKEAVFVEKNPKAMECIKENLKFTRLEKKGITLTKDVLNALYQLEGDKVFDYIFMDPPYDQELEKQVLKYLAGSSLVYEDTVIIVVTYGHYDIICRSCKIVDELIVGVLNNKAKMPLFSVEERVKMLKEVTKDLPNVRIIPFDGLLVDFAERMDADMVIRGLRAITDFEYELQMSQTNHKLSPNVETMFLTTSIEYSYLSSTTVREIAAFGGDVTQFVPQAVAVELEKKMKEKGECN